MKKTTTIIIISVLTLAFCCSLLVGATYAIFDAQEDSTMEVTTGTINVTERFLTYRQYQYDIEGYIPKQFGKGEMNETGTGYTFENMNKGCALFVEVNVRNWTSDIDYVTLIPAKFMLHVYSASGVFSEDALSFYQFYALNSPESTVQRKISNNEIVFEWQTVTRSTDGISISILFEYDKGDYSAAINDTISIKVDYVHGNTPVEGFDSVPTADQQDTNALATMSQLPAICQTRKYGEQICNK